jgi:DNA-binding NarL/FixJ family response regulator
MRILLVDDHKIFLHTLKLALLQLQPSVEVVTCSGPTAARPLVEGRADAFDIILLDLNMPGFARLEALAYFRGLCPEIPCVVLSSSEDPELVHGSVDMGAYGFVSKTAEFSQLEEALGRLVSGNVWLPASALSLHADTPLPDQWTRAGVHITARQRDVLRFLVQGKTNKMIARALGISDGTVKTHVAHLMEMLQVNTRTQIVFVLGRHGIRIQDIPVAPGDDGVRAV